MYQLFESFINHVWNNEFNSTTEQQLIYSGCIAFVLIFFVWVLDLIHDIFVATRR